MSLSLGLGGFGEAAVEDVAVLAGAAGLLVEPLGAENGIVSDARCVTVAAGGLGGILSRTAGAASLVG